MADHNAKQPEPVMTRAGVVAALSALSAALVHFHAPGASAWLSVHSDEIAGGILTTGTLVSGWLARKHVTPVASPKNADGEPLSPTVVAPILPPDASDIVKSG